MALIEGIIEKLIGFLETLARYLSLDHRKIRAFLFKYGIYNIYERLLEAEIRKKQLPKHIGVIIDGNRRWARTHNLETWIGHVVGAENVETFIKWCLELGIRSITVYAFSTDNFKRDHDEIEHLMKLIRKKLEELKSNPLIYKHRVKVKVIGRWNLLPPALRKAAKEVEEVTKDHDQHFLNIAVAYGGRAEIVDAVRKIARDVRAGHLSPEDIDEELFESYLYTGYLPEDVRDPDLIIRTSGEERLSGFLLWQCAYSELCFVDVYWPEFRRIDLLRAIRTYQRRQRRFGR